MAIEPSAARCEREADRVTRRDRAERMTAEGDLSEGEGRHRVRRGDCRDALQPPDLHSSSQETASREIDATWRQRAVKLPQITPAR